MTHGHLFSDCMVLHFTCIHSLLCDHRYRQGLPFLKSDKHVGLHTLETVHGFCFSRFFTSLKTPSVGIKSGQYGGKKHTLAPAWLSTTSWTWWMLALSIITTECELTLKGSTLVRGSSAQNLQISPRLQFPLWRKRHGYNLAKLLHGYAEYRLPRTSRR